MDGVTEHHGSEKCMVELEFTVDRVVELDKKAKLYGLKNHKELILKAVEHYLGWQVASQEEAFRDSLMD